MLNPLSGPKKMLLMKPKEAKNRERNGAGKEGRGPRNFAGSRAWISFIGC